MEEWEEAELNRLTAALREQVRRHDRRMTAQMEQSLAATASVAPVAAPLECHPYYRDRHPLIKDWLDGKCFGGHTLRLPFRRPLRMSFASDAELYATAATDSITLTKQLAWGLAPYVGDPFVYTWWVASDNHGRMVANDSEITYIGP